MARMKIKFIILFGLLGSAFALSACEKLEPQPEPNVILQADGMFTSGEGKDMKEVPAVFILHKTYQGYDGPIVEIQEKKTVVVEGEEDKVEMVTIATALLESNLTLRELLSQIDGPLKTRNGDTSVEITQPGAMFKRAILWDKTSAPDATHGILIVEGTRWIKYRLGLIEYGFDGNVKFRLRKDKCTDLASFEGKTTREPPPKDSRTPPHESRGRRDRRREDLETRSACS